MMNRTEKRYQERQTPQVRTCGKRTEKRLKMKKNPIGCYFCGIQCGYLHLGQMDIVSNCIAICPVCKQSEQMFVEKYRKLQNPEFVLEIANNSEIWMNPKSDLIQICLEYKKALDEFKR